MSCLVYNLCQDVWCFWHQNLFYRATPGLSAVFAVDRCLSATFVNGIQTAEDIVQLLSRPGSPINLVFLTPSADTQCLLVVLVKLSLLAKWLARKTPQRNKPNHKAQAEESLWLCCVYCILSLFYCMIFVLSPGPMWYISYFYGMIAYLC